MTDRQLIEEIIKGNQAGFKFLTDKYQALVLNTCNSFLHNKQNAEDVTQEVFIEVFLSAEKFKNDAKISTWLYRIAVNKSLNYIRDNKKRNIIKSLEDFFSNKQETNFQITDENAQLSENIEKQNERIKLLHKTINSLSKNQKTAFTLHKFENLSYKQISEVMNLSLASVEGLIHRAKKNVQKRILKYYKKKTK